MIHDAKLAIFHCGERRAPIAVELSLASGRFCYLIATILVSPIIISTPAQFPIILLSHPGAIVVTIVTFGQWGASETNRQRVEREIESY
ncbi:hypothetical protein TIFTF001_016423 [Ficus carica]|uniref:Uncharacterized protein n=1 Tax=Ficus carica TaxID=3494 RepID=A0AA88A8U2_FICCA|nr:hypothetical protein TIFTF001_016423 [Ficus carica]